MKNKYLYYAIGAIVLIILILIIIAQSQTEDERDASPTPSQTQSPAETASPTAQPSPEETQGTQFERPVDGFDDRITKKEFGQFVSPEDSPVENERFTGYHTGVDVEYEDISTDVPVRSIFDGTVIYSSYVSGYGGVVIVAHEIDNEDISSIYGHLNPDAMLPTGTVVAKGQQLGVLGEEGYETDEERRHLHFGIYDGHDVELRGYVDNESELDKWHDPVEFLNS